MNEARVVFLSDGDVELRPIRKGNAELFEVWINDPQVRQFLASYLPMMLEQEQDWISKLKSDSHNIVLVIVYKGQPVGIIGLHRINWKDRTSTTGSVIGDKSLWGQGIGRRAKKLLLGYAFEELGLNKINSSVIEFNERSLRYSLACGYKEEGRRRQQYFRHGKYWDEICLGITRADWDKRKEEK